LIWAGEVVDLVDCIEPASVIFERIGREAEKWLQQSGGWLRENAAVRSSQLGALRAERNRLVVDVTHQIQSDHTKSTGAASTRPAHRSRRVDTMQGWLREFKTFIMRGNLVELAVAFVIGLAFAALVTALVTDLITPIIAAIFGSHDFSNLTFTINGSTFRYGDFINALITFVSIAAAVFFFVVKPMNYLMERRKRGEEPEAEAPPDIQLLTEIRDALTSRS
jgi:large conductance mechanosensitive channel